MRARSWSARPWAVRLAWCAAGVLVVAGAALWLAAGQKLSVSLGEREEKSLGRRLRAPLVLAAVGLAAWWFALFMI